MKQFVSLFLAAVLCCALFAGCEPKDVTGGDTSAPAVSSEPEEVSSEPEASSEPTEEIPEGALLNVLTGRYELQEGESTLPVGVMVCNDNYTKSQPGLDKADLYVETETEGGVSRLMAVFANAAHIPEMLGPLRSGRTPYIQIARALGWVYVHAGGSPKALSMVKAADIKNINLLSAANTSWRDSKVRAANANKYDHCLVTNAEKIGAWIDKKTQYGTTNDRAMPWDYATEPAVGSAAQTLQIAISSHSSGNSYFVYDETAGAYLKFRGTATKNTAHCATDGTQLQVSNIVILYAERFVEQVERYTRYGFHLEKGGEALVLSNGVCRNVTYTCSQTEMTLTDEQGSRVALQKGKTYVYIINDKMKDKTVIK